MPPTRLLDAPLLIRTPLPWPIAGLVPDAFGPTTLLCTRLPIDAAPAIVTPSIVWAEITLRGDPGTNGCALVMPPPMTLFGESSIRTPLAPFPSAATRPDPSVPM